MVELAYAFGGEDLGTIPCDGMICSTPSGSTAYNLSNGGPVLVRGVDAMAITFIAPHSLARAPTRRPARLAAERPQRHRGCERVRARRRSPGGRDEARQRGHDRSRRAETASSRRRRRRRSSAGTARRSPRRANGRRQEAPLRLDWVLRRLRIENLVLIREAELELAPGLNAITGETGAGKTILAQAVGLLLGMKGDDSFVGPAGEEAYVEAELDLPDELDELGGPQAGRRGRARRRAARLRRRAHTRIRMGPCGGARGRRCRRRAGRRHVRGSSSSAGSRGRPYQLELLDRFAAIDRRADAECVAGAAGGAQAARRAHRERRLRRGAHRGAARACRGHRGDGGRR